MDNRREFLKKASLLAGGAGMLNVLPMSIQKAFAIDPATGSTFLDAEHIVFLMQENRSFDHTFGTLKGVRGFNDPHPISLPDTNPVWFQTNKTGETFAPFHLDIKDTKATWMSSLPHSWADQTDAGNYGKHDKWLDAKHSGHEDYSGMPLTMGYYNRKDIPFYYALADAFTVCDQNFCSSLTGTTPNRLYFWSGTIRGTHDENTPARVWNGDAEHNNMVDWKTFPERLEEHGIPWKVYQNETSIGVGFEDEEDAWLANFTDNPLEFFSQYNIKLSSWYIDSIPKALARIPVLIQKQEKLLGTTDPASKKAEHIKESIENLKRYQAILTGDQKIYTREKYEQLSPTARNIHDKAFSTNKNDPAYHELTVLKYQDGNTEREVKVPKGDILHQFREDVKQGTLPTVSWIVAPENYSDHPGAAWYGAWYTSEVMDILTQNPELWKKTIFIITYDENDGYFDHIPPFRVPHKEGMGKVSAGIDIAEEYVKKNQQSSGPEDMREGPIGLGYRVPMIIVSPWSRGGFVCSEVFDHTSSLQFLEKFLSHKYGRRIEEPNITQWRRTICGDLTASFRPYNGEKINAPATPEKEEFIEGIHKAKFKKLPSNFNAVTKEEIRRYRTNSAVSALLPVQEKGTRAASPLPYELYVDGQLTENKQSFGIRFAAGNEIFGDRSSGSPFNVYVPGKFRDQPVETWAYSTKAGDALNDEWNLGDFEDNKYHLRVYGPNGFFREFTGDNTDPDITFTCGYERGHADPKKLTGNITLKIINKTGKPRQLEITDNRYKVPMQAKTVKGETTIILDLSRNFSWYDFTVRLKGNQHFSQRFAGHVETGNPSRSDPAMGREI